MAPQGFENCVAGGGKIRTATGPSERFKLKEGQYRHYCYKRNKEGKVQTWNDIKVVSLQDNHIPALWNILQEYPDYFADDLNITDLESFGKYITEKAIDPLVGIRDDEILGCGYLEDLHDRMGCVALFTKRRAVKPFDTIRILKDMMPIYFARHNLKILYAVTRVTNRACIRLMRNLSFLGFETVRGFKKVRGEIVDYVIASIVRDKAEKIDGLSGAI